MYIVPTRLILTLLTLILVKLKPLKLNSHFIYFCSLKSIIAQYIALYNNCLNINRNSIINR